MLDVVEHVILLAQPPHAAYAPHATAGALDLKRVVLEQLAQAEKVQIGKLVQLTVRLKPATKARPGRNPATGEAITIKAKPASVDVRARPRKGAKDALPSVQKASRKLAG